MYLPITQVSEIYRQHKERLLAIGRPQEPPSQPTAIILGGQSACGKTMLIDRLTARGNPAYFVINGDEYREYHPEFEFLIRNYPLEFPSATQNFSNVFTENLIHDASGRRFNMIIEGTMRNPDVPSRTAALLHEKGYKVGIAVVAAHPKITELGTYRRYLDKMQKYGYGRLADINSHNAACTGLLTSADCMYTNKSVDSIAIYSYLAQQKLAEYNLINGKWSNSLLPSIVINRARLKQISNPAILMRHIRLGVEAIKLLGTSPIAQEAQSVLHDLVAIQKQSWSKSKIDKLFDIASQSKEKLLKETIGKATEKQLSDIRAAGIDISEDYIHTIDNYAIVHSLKKHGNNKTEELRGQLAITKQDFEKIPDILANYNKLIFEKNSRGQDVIIYQQSYGDGTTLYAEEIRVGRKELAMVSMYKTKRIQHKVESCFPDGLMPSYGVLSSTSKTPSEFSTGKDTNNSPTDKKK